MNKQTEKLLDYLLATAIAMGFVWFIVEAVAK
jgi:hypothetical protein